MKKQLTRIFAAAALAGAVFLGGALSAYANSALRFWNGVDAAGAALSVEGCPIEVEKELLTFDIGEFPKSDYRSAEEFAGYNARVTAEYTFYNPAEYEVTAALAFPYGQFPDYASRSFGYETEAEKYGVYINGEKITARVRHTLYYDGPDVSKLSNKYVGDELYSPDMPVYKQTFTVSGITRPVTGNYSDVYVSYTRKGGGILAAAGKSSVSGNELRYGYRKNGDTITLWYIGSLPDYYEWEVYVNESGRKVIIDGSVQLTESEQMTFEELALISYRASDPDISKTDHYNAFVSYLHYLSDGSMTINSFVPGLGMSGRLMRWYEYDIALGAGERLTNTVTAPMYPDVDKGYSPAGYNYVYLLSPAKTWSSFGTLHIKVNTPYYLFRSNMEGFSETEDGYLLSLEGLPDGELEFTMSTSASPEGSSAGNGSFGSVAVGLLMTAAVIIGIIGLLAGIVCAVIIAVTLVIVKSANRRRQC